MPTFDATKSGPNANSYATVDEADDYFEFEYGADEWNSLDDDTKERLLVTATRMINRFKPLYDKLDENQSLNFPMDVSPDGFDIAKEACIIQAIHLHRNHENFQEALAGMIQGLKKESLGKTSKEVTGYNPMGRYAPGVLKMLSNYVVTALQVSR